jgi:hypothetical protein
MISHRSAAALLRLLDMGPAVIDVIAPPSRGRKIDGIRFHRVRPPRREETGTVAGIPCTSPARTLVDLAGTVGDRTLRSCFERAAQRKMLDLPAIEASMDPRRRGINSLRTLIDEWRGAAPIAKKGRLKSPLEAKVLPLLIRHHLIAPLPNAPVEIPNGRIEVDFLWPEHRFVVEADSRDFHATHRRLRARSLARPGTYAGRLHEPPGHEQAGGNRSPGHRGHHRLAALLKLGGLAQPSDLVIRKAAPGSLRQLPELQRPEADPP